MVFRQQRFFDANGMLTCTRCGGTKSPDDFHNNKRYATKKFPWCKECVAKKDRRYQAQRCASTVVWKRNNPQKSREHKRTDYVRNKARFRAASTAYKKHVAQAIPKWANRFFIEEAYALAALRTKMFGFPWHVDHILPLRSKMVCGLHVENNLQVIPGVENLRKGNKLKEAQNVL